MIKYRIKWEYPKKQESGHGKPVFTYNQAIQIANGLNQLSIQRNWKTVYFVEPVVINPPQDAPES